jgi:hypothetical protein
MSERLRRTLLAACLVGFWLSLLACWAAAPLAFYPYTVFDAASCAGLPAGASFDLAIGTLPLLIAMSAVYALPIGFLIGLSRFSANTGNRVYPKAAIVLFSASLAITWVETLGDALACNASGGFPLWDAARAILVLGSTLATLALFIEAVSMARHYVVDPD